MARHVGVSVALGQRPQSGLLSTMAITCYVTKQYIEYHHGINTNISLSIMICLLVKLTGNNGRVFSETLDVTGPVNMVSDNAGIFT